MALPFRVYSSGLLSSPLTPNIGAVRRFASGQKTCLSCFLLSKTAAVSLPWMEIEPGLRSVPVCRSEPRSGNDRVRNQGDSCNIVGGVLGRFFAASRRRLREIGARLGL